MTGKPNDSQSWMERELARFTYKPGWRLQLVDAAEFFREQRAYHLIVSYKAQDSRTPDGPETLIRVNVSVPPYIDEEPDAFAHWLIEAVSEIERHEAREWLRRDGIMLFDPHVKAAA